MDDSLYYAYGSHLPVPVAISSGEAEYISEAVAWMRASHLRVLMNDLRFMSSENYNLDIANLGPVRIIIGNEAVIYIFLWFVNIKKFKQFFTFELPCIL